jgi:hypothetical protein
VDKKKPMGHGIGRERIGWQGRHGAGREVIQ